MGKNFLHTQQNSEVLNGLPRLAALAIVIFLLYGFILPDLMPGVTGNDLWCNRGICRKHPETADGCMGKDRKKPHPSERGLFPAYHTIGKTTLISQPWPCGVRLLFPHSSKRNPAPVARRCMAAAHQFSKLPRGTCPQRHPVSQTRNRAAFP